MVNYFTRNEFPKIEKDFLKKETFEKIHEYLKNSEFQNDFKRTYWEHTGISDNQTSNLIYVQGKLGGDFYSNFQLGVRYDEDLNENNLDVDKLKQHYKNLLDIIFESE